VVASQCPGGILFPNLRDLFYHSVSDGDWPWLEVLAAPTLQKLFLIFDSLNSEAITITSNLPQRCPATRCLRLKCGSTPARLSSDLVCSWKNLHRIQLNVCDSRALTHLSLMPNVSELLISSLDPPTHDHFTFPALRKLRLGPCGFNHSLDFMRGITAPRLSILGIDVDTATSIRWHLLFQAICERLSDAPLSRFNFRYYNADSGIEWPDPTVDDIRPLYIFPNVATFTFDSPKAPSKLDDHWIQEIATAWPNLTKLKLHGPITAFSQVTVAGVAFLARKCQNLSDFHLQIDGRLIGPPLEDKACALRPNVRLESISLGCSPIEDVAQVAVVLARALPNLRHICVEDGNPIGYTRLVGGSRPFVHATRWKQVEVLVHEIRDREGGPASSSEQG
jgi:hypothetical protein